MKFAVEVFKTVGWLGTGVVAVACFAGALALHITRRRK